MSIDVITDQPRPVPLGVIPVIDKPFSRVAVDILGLIKRASERGNRYILTVMEYATRYLEAGILRRDDTDTGTILRRDNTETVTTALNSWVEWWKRSIDYIRHLTTTSYHPQCNGLVKKFNGTLKLLLKKLCDGHPRSWDPSCSVCLPQSFASKFGLLAIWTGLLKDSGHSHVRPTRALDGWTGWRKIQDNV